MQSFPENIYSVASVREMDRVAIEEFGIPGYTLMQRAAAAALEFARDRFPTRRRWQVICGSGNNGGDGYVLARLAAKEGITASVVSLVDPESLSGDAATAYDDFVHGGGVVRPWAGSLDDDAELLVDAILGSGLQREVDGEFAAAVAAINNHAAPVHALDIATGIHGDSGHVMGCAVEAQLTTTFVGLKPGLFLANGPDYCGEISFDGLSIDSAVSDGLAAVFRCLDEETLAHWLQPRRKAAHKGDFGHVLVIAGGPGMAGAAHLCGAAGLRTGAGRVSVATHPDHAATISGNCPELMARAVAGHDDLQPLLETADVIAFGPGLGQTEWARGLVADVAAAEQPSVWDADALNLLSAAPDRNAQRIITPHPGEAATLLSRTSAEVQGDRKQALLDLQAQFGGVAVLKGAGTLVSAASGAPWMSRFGNPGMAAPGMGDVLTGIVAAMLAQGLPLELAAAIGVYIHARAGDRAATGGQRGMIASDLINALRGVVNP